MGLKETIQEDVKSAMRARDQHRLNTLRGLMSEIKRIEIDTRAEVDDGAILGILQKEIKKRRDAIQFAEQANRADLVEQNQTEIAMIQAYLGAQLSEDDLRRMVTELVNGGERNLGKIMAALNKDHKGQFDGKLASDVAKSLIEQSS